MPALEKLKCRVKIPKWRYIINDQNAAHGDASMVDARSETKTKRKCGMQDQYSMDLKVNSNRRFNIR